MTPEQLARWGRRLVKAGYVIAPPSALFVIAWWFWSKEPMSTGILIAWLGMLVFLLVLFGRLAERSAREHEISGTDEPGSE